MSVAFDGVNGTIASGSKDKTVRLWQPSVYAVSYYNTTCSVSCHCCSF